jgi:hypothetical protein
MEELNNARKQVRALLERHSRGREELIFEELIFELLEHCEENAELTLYETQGSYTHAELNGWLLAYWNGWLAQPEALVSYYLEFIRCNFSEE